ncbi:MAG: DUF177 domain-containing protein [Nitrospiraceae bacterium]|nr:DUF177 domain-containing protein [Nitrospiraceae bacterium]
MKIVIADIPDDGLIVDLAENLTPEDVSLSCSATARISLQKVGTEVVVSGNLKADMGLQCSRCLRDFRQSIETPVNVVYHPIEEAGEDRHALRDDEMDMGFYKGGELDLRELLKEQVLLNEQMKPLCSEQCKGICPKCGTDLNAGQCTCGGREVDPRLAALRNLLDK